MEQIDSKKPPKPSKHQTLLTFYYYMPSMDRRADIEVAFNQNWSGQTTRIDSGSGLSICEAATGWQYDYLTCVDEPNRCCVQGRPAQSTCLGGNGYCYDRLGNDTCIRKSDGVELPGRICEMWCSTGSQEDPASRDLCDGLAYGAACGAGGTCINAAHQRILNLGYEEVPNPIQRSTYDREFIDRLPQTTDGCDSDECCDYECTDGPYNGWYLFISQFTYSEELAELLDVNGYRHNQIGIDLSRSSTGGGTDLYIDDFIVAEAQ